MSDETSVDPALHISVDEERTRKIRLITEICRRVYAAPGLAEALQVAVEAVVDDYGYYCACVAFVENHGRSIVHQAHHHSEPGPG